MRFSKHGHHLCNQEPITTPCCTYGLLYCLIFITSNWGGDYLPLVDPLFDYLTGSSLKVKDYAAYLWACWTIVKWTFVYTTKDAIFLHFIHYRDCINFKNWACIQYTQHKYNDMKSNVRFTPIHISVISHPNKTKVSVQVSASSRDQTLSILCQLFLRYNPSKVIRFLCFF